MTRQTKLMGKITFKDERTPYSSQPPDHPLTPSNNRK
jgi:hypothetical protein